MTVKSKIDLLEFPDPGNRYTLGECLSCGAYAKVFSASDSEAGDKKVAVKIQELCDARKRYLEQEYKILRDLSSHANLTDFYGTFRRDADIWFVMELCEGGDARSLTEKLLLQNRRLAEEHIAFILKEAVKAVIFLHQNRIIHRDIKAKNVNLTADGEVKLSGFDFSCTLNDTLDKTSTRIGSPYWMAPEVANCQRNDEHYGNGADVWALGITAIELGEGKTPLEPMHPSRALFHIVVNPPPKLSRLSNWSSNYHDFISECLVKNPEHRPFVEEVVDHPFLSQIPENNYHMTLEIKSLISDVNGFDQIKTPEEISIAGKYSKSSGGALEKIIVEDLASLDRISESSVMGELEARMQTGEFHTFVGDVLVVLNPNEKLDIFGEEHHKKYVFKSRSDNAPHVFAVADSAYQNALHHMIPQRILLSGESGSGKTSNYLYITEHLLYLGKNRNINLDRLKGAIKLIHSLTHASTPINDYSTRCVLKTEFKYGNTGKITGASFNVHLLEKWRISAVDMCQGNFHFLYYIYDGLSNSNKLKQYHLKPDRKYRYFRLGEDLDFKTPKMDINGNFRKFKTILTIFEDFEFTEQEIDTVFSIISAVLNIGEIRFQKTEENDAQTENKEYIEKVAELLKVESRKLEWALTNYCLIKKDTVLRRKSTVDEARDARDVLANNLYLRLVDYVVALINKKLSVGSVIFGEKYYVTVFDCFGFECFKQNHLPQLLINCLNEELQYHYLQRVFSWEYLDVKEEEVEYKPIKYYDNKDTLDTLLNKSEGVLSFIDQASKSGRHGKYVMDFIQNSERKHIKVVGFSEFSIAHYTGKVIYNVKEMPDKNRDFLPPEITETLQLSDNPIVKLLFTNKLDKNGNLIVTPDNDDCVINKKRYKFKSRSEKHGQEYCQIKNMRTSIHIFKAFSLGFLKELSIGSGSGGTHFVRCIRSDLSGKPGAFNKELIKQQVRALAVVETAKARQIGFPHRIAFPEFLRRYQFLAFDFNENVEVTIDNCRLLLIRLNMEGWATGKSKVFLKYHNEEYLARIYETQVKRITKVQSIFRRFLAKCSVVKKIKEEEAKCLSRVTQEHYQLTEEEAAAIIQKAYRESAMRRSYVEFAKDYKILDEETCNFIRKFALRWKNKSILKVLFRYKALRYQDSVNFAQQVHLYNSGAYFDLLQINDPVDLTAVDEEAQVSNWLGEPKLTVMKIPYRLDEIPFYDTSDMCNLLTNPGIASEKDEAWDIPYSRRKLISPKAAEDIEDLKLEENLIDIPFSRDPEVSLKELSEEPDIAEDKNRTKSDKDTLNNKTVKEVENKSIQNKISQKTINKYENTLNNKIREKNVSPKEVEDLINSNAKPANEDFDYFRSPMINKPKSSDPILEMRNICRRVSLGTEDDPPFNFQGMLRKTNYKNESFKKSHEKKIDEISLAKNKLNKVNKENADNGLDTKIKNISGKKIREELSPGVFLEGLEIEL